MAERTIARYELKIDCEDDVVIVRRKVRDLAQARGFGTFVVAAITIATSELTRNVWAHAKRGTAVVEEVEDGNRRGVKVELRDQGPGIADLERAMAGGNSTNNTLGLGLSGSKRLVDAFHIETEVGKATRVTIVKWARF